MNRWAFMRRMRLTRTDGAVYLDRVRLVQTPWFGLYLHRMDAPDPGVHLHDHPWPFLSLILRGGYEEQVASSFDAPSMAWVAERFPRACLPGVPRSWGRGSVHRVRLSECHRITTLARVPTWTLVLCGRRSRSWGFYTPDGFVEHREYDHPTLRRLEEVQS